MIIIKIPINKESKIIYINIFYRKCHIVFIIISYFYVTSIEYFIIKKLNCIFIMYYISQSESSTFGTSN